MAGRTTIVIAHRLSTIRNADMILVSSAAASWARLAQAAGQGAVLEDVVGTGRVRGPAAEPGPDRPA
jgi:hypothetical protein